MTEVLIIPKSGQSSPSPLSMLANAMSLHQKHGFKTKIILLAVVLSKYKLGISQMWVALTLKIGMKFSF